MIELHASEWYTITGRGRLACVDVRQINGCPERIANETQLPLHVGQYISIDGVQYEIRGIEYTRALVSPPFIRPDVGLLVREVEGESAEQRARDLLERCGVDDAQSFSAGDVVELANLIAAKPSVVDDLNITPRFNLDDLIHWLKMAQVRYEDGGRVTARIEGTAINIYQAGTYRVAINFNDERPYLSHFADDDA